MIVLIPRPVKPSVNRLYITIRIKKIYRIVVAAIYTDKKSETMWLFTVSDVNGLVIFSLSRLYAFHE